MTQLYRPEAHEPLTQTPWEEDRVRERIRAIVADAERAYTPETLWPADEWDSWKVPLPLTSLYAGAAGVAWALDALARRGFDGALDPRSVALRALELWREAPDLFDDDDFPLPEPPESGLFVGETGVLAVALQLAPSPELADDLHARVRANLDNPAEELFWGAPGTLLAASAAYSATGDERWSAAWRETASKLLERREDDGLWTQRFYGREQRGLSVPHGVVGNVAVLLGGGDLLDGGVAEELRRDTATILEDAAVVEDGRANWPHPLGRELLREDGEIRVQWCLGAPGIVIHAPYVDDELLLAGAELTWSAGPPTMEKGPGICHGTAGNGYAFLKTFERTGDERWLERARRFAVHALEQVERRGHGRYSLFTGDVGAALYAADCIDARAEFPIVDSWSARAAT